MAQEWFVTSCNVVTNLKWPYYACNHRYVPIEGPTVGVKRLQSLEHNYHTWNHRSDLEKKRLETQYKQPTTVLDKYHRLSPL
jgi:hypothetical protein